MEQVYARKDSSYTRQPATFTAARRALNDDLYKYKHSSPELDLHPCVEELQ